MYVESLFIMLLIITVLPILVILYYPNIFFCIMSVLLMFTSIGNLKVIIKKGFKKHDNEYVNDEEMEKMIIEMNEAAGIDIHKIGCSFFIIIDLIIVTYFLYMYFLFNITFFKAITVILIANWVYDIIIEIDKIINFKELKNRNKFTSWKHNFKKFYACVYNILTISIIFVVIIQKCFI